MESKNRSIQLSRIFIENGSNFFPFWRLLKKRSVNDFILASYMLSHPNPTQQCGETHCYMIFHSHFDWKHSEMYKGIYYWVAFKFPPPPGGGELNNIQAFKYNYSLYIWCHKVTNQLVFDHLYGWRIWNYFRKAFLLYVLCMNQPPLFCSVVASAVMETVLTLFFSPSFPFSVLFLWEIIKA